ncbi:MAG: hypothetical protein HON27_08850, partial [Candidatus Marinimicrobia bacterium]|nr:hypothetical protein [Candidatus Neomarinimicrobiota bacterium]
LNVTASLVVQSNSANAVSSLKINGDAIFAFPDGEGIQVGHSSDSGKRGIINASGATFTTQDQDDQWAGIRFNNYSDDAGTILENCTVEYATAGIYCQSSSPTITNNTFRYNTDGIDADNASAPLVSGNTFIANTYPVQYFAQNIDSTLYGNTYLGNYLTDSTSSNFIYVYGEGDDYRLSSNKTYDWLLDGAPYRITDDLHVWEDNSNSEIAVLKIYPGAALLFEPGTHLQIGSTSDGDAGALQADSVTFSQADTNGWDRIKIYNYASDELTVINNCVIEYATDGINIESASPTITSSSIRYNTNGINVDASSEPVIRDNSFTANGVPVYICARSIDGNIQGNTYENNTTNAIVVYGTEDDGSWIRLNDNKTYNWLLDGAPYYLNTEVRVERENNSGQLTILQIAKGVTVQFAENTRLRIGDGSNGNYRGAIQAQGVTFTAFDTSSAWTGIRFNNYSDDAGTILDSCVIEYATDGIYCQSSNPTITNTVFRYNEDGIDADPGSAPILVDNTFTSNQYPVKIYGDQIDGNLYGNTYYGNAIDTLSSSDYIFVYGDESNNSYERLHENKTYDWLLDGAPYRLTDHIQVWYNNHSERTATLKLYPQVQMVFEAGKYLSIGTSSNGDDFGALQADSVTFTALDTSLGWSSIKIFNFSRDDETYLDHCIIEYADDGIYCQSSNPTITNTVFRYNEDGIEADDASRPTVTDNSFTENTRPVSVYAQRIDSTLYGNTYTDNVKDYIEVQGDNIQDNGTFIWAMDGAPYVVNGHVYVQRDNNNSQLSTLRIEDGTIVQFNDGAWLYIGHESNDSYRGALQADGVTFTRSDATDTWLGIRIRNFSDDATTYLDNCTIEYAGDGIYCESSNP